jgi:sensor domain CHASE-containing protein
MMEQLAAEHDAVVRRAITVQLRWFAALIGVPVLAVVVAAVLMLMNARTLDRAAERHAVNVVAEALDVRARQLDRVVKDYAWSNETVEAIQQRHDREWADASFGSDLYGTHAYDFAFVVAPDGSTFYAAHEGETVADDIAQALGDDLWRSLVERSRSAVDDSEPEAMHAYTPMREGRLGIISAAAILPKDSWTGDHPEGAPYVLVVVRSLIPKLLSELTGALGLSDLTFSLSAVPPVTGLRLTGPDGKPVGSMSWQARGRGAQLLTALAPTFGVLLLLVLAFMWRGWQLSRAAPR